MIKGERESEIVEGDYIYKGFSVIAEDRGRERENEAVGRDYQGKLDS